MNDINLNPISLNEANHTYSLNNKDIEFISVTTYIGKFFEPFNQIQIAEKLIKTSPKYSHLSVEEIILEWNKSRDYGTLIHKQIEEAINTGDEPKEFKAKNAISWLNDYLSDKDYSLYVEKPIFSKELKLAGTMDLLIKLKNSNEYIIIDWKTNKKIDKRSYRQKMGIHSITSNIEDCKYNIYAFQLSLYRYLLEKYYGLNIKEQMLVHIGNGEIYLHKTPYYEAHMESLAQLREEK